MDTTYRITALNRDSGIITSTIVVHPAGATEHLVFFPGELFSSPGGWRFFVSLPTGPLFQVGDSVTVSVSTPVLSLQSAGELIRMEYAVPTEMYFDSPETDGLDGAFRAAVSGDGNLLFVMAFVSHALSVWRVNPSSGTLEQTALYQDIQIQSTSSFYIENVAGRFDGLIGATSVAVSGDGNLLFVTAGPFGAPGALSVWRVNASSGTLEQTALYQDSDVQDDSFGYIEDADRQFDGLDGASNVAVSGDGNLLFVTAGPFGAPGTLSVWRVNASSGTLEQTALYQDSDVQDDSFGYIEDADRQFDGLDGASNVAVSGDGNLLFVTASVSDALSVWRVNEAAGTLEQTALYQDSDVQDDSFGYIENVDRQFDGLAGASNVAVSGDGKLLFVIARYEDALSVWRVNEAAGTLEQTALYQDNGSFGYIEDADRQFGGLAGASNIAVSGDGKLLFVTASNYDALSIWRVNTSVGNLSQTALYQDSDVRDGSFRYIEDADRRFDGLDSAEGVVVSDDLLFVTASDDDALSVWRIKDATVHLEEPTVISLQFDLPVVREVMVTVTAQNDARMEEKEEPEEIEVTLSPGTSSVDAIFPAGTLSPGRWIFTARAEPSAALDTRAARTAVQVVPPLLSLKLQQERVAVGSTVALTVLRTIGAPVDTTYSITALNRASGMTFSTPVIHPASATEHLVSFPSQRLSSSGQWEFFISLPAGSLFQVGDSVTVSVFTPTPILSLQPRGELIRMEHAVPTGVYFDSPETGGLSGEAGVAVSDDLLFVTSFDADALSVWRVNAEAGTLSQTALYQDSQAASPITVVDGQVDGLGGATGATVSGDGNLLFVTASGDDALSVWRVNDEAGTLSQTALYQDLESDSPIAEVDGRVDGLFGAATAAVSGDGKLLFVTGFAGELSVWQVNAEAGTLSQTALYQNVSLDRANGIILFGADVAVSSDGKLLFIGGVGFDFIFDSLGTALSVWRVNESSGTLSQTAFYYKEFLEFDSRGAEGVAVSGDLLFVTSFDADALSVWRINAEEGNLRRTVTYRDLGFRVSSSPTSYTGLQGAAGAAISGNLLFVTARFSDALSIWRINTEEGNLRRTALYQDIQIQSTSNYIEDVDGRVDGLGGAGSIAVSGGLLFVTASGDDALSVWHINNAEVPFGVPLMIRVQPDLPVGRKVMVTVTAQSGAMMREEREEVVTLSPETPFADAIFPAGTLSPGRWIFTARGEPSAALDTRAARTAVRVSSLLFLEPQQNQLAVGSTVNLTVRAEAGALMDTTYEIFAESMVSAMTSSITVIHPTGVTVLRVSFPGQLFSSTEQWAFSIRLPNDSPFRVGDGSTVTVRIIIPLLQLMPLQEQFTLGNPVTLTVRATAGAPTDVTYNIRAANTATMAETTITVVHPAGVTAQETSFSAQEIASLGPGQLEFSISLPADSPFQISDGSTATAQTVLPLLRLMPLQEQFAVGSTVILTVQSDAGAPMDTTYEIIAENIDSAMTSSIMVTHPAAATEHPVSFTGQLFSSTGQWTFSILLPDNAPFRIGDGSTATVRIIIPLLQLMPLRQQFVVGSTVVLTVYADMGAPLDTTYSITARNTFSEQTSFTISVEHPANSTSQEVFFPGQLFSEPGQWTFSIRLTNDSPFQIGDGSTATVRIVTPLLPELVLQQGQLLTAGGTVTLTARHETIQPTVIDYTVTALNAVSATTSSIPITYPADTTEYPVPFPGLKIASPGQWRFFISLPTDSPIEGVPITVTISLDFIEPQGIINADDLMFALRYLVLCEGSAEGCRENGETLDGLARNLNLVDEIETLPAALQIPDINGGGEERPAANWFTLLLGLQELPVELLFPDPDMTATREQRQHLENAIRSMLSVQEEETP